MACATSEACTSLSFFRREPNTSTRAPSLTPSSAARSRPFPKITAGRRIVQPLASASLNAISSAPRLAAEEAPLSSGAASKGVNSVMVPPSRTESMSYTATELT